MPSPLFSVRQIAYKSEDAKQRLHALQILVSGGALLDTDGPDGTAERKRLDELVSIGCEDSYEFFNGDGRDAYTTTARGWYHVVTCPGAKLCYTISDWHPSA